MYRLLAGAALPAFMCCGCATILTGRTETVRIDSEPQGVAVNVDGTMHTTPVIVSLARDADHYVRFPNGQTVDITRHFSGATLGNIILGGVIGIIIDAASGAAMGDLKPDKMMYRNGKVYNLKSKKVILPGGEEVRETNTMNEIASYEASRSAIQQPPPKHEPARSAYQRPPPASSVAAPAPPPVSESSRNTDQEIAGKIRRFARANPPYDTDPDQWLRERQAEFDAILGEMDGCVIGHFGGNGSTPNVQLFAEAIPRDIRTCSTSKTPADRLAAVKNLVFTLKLLKREWRAISSMPVLDRQPPAFMPDPGTVVKLCETPRTLPENGHVFARQGKAEIRFTVRMQAGAGTCFVKLIGPANRRPVISFLVHDSETAQVEVPAGRYELRYATGTNWYGSRYLFGPSTKFARASEQIDISVNSAGARYTLGPSDDPGTNVEASSIPPDAF